MSVGIGPRDGYGSVMCGVCEEGGWCSSWSIDSVLGSWVCYDTGLLGYWSSMCDDNGLLGYYSSVCDDTGLLGYWSSVCYDTGPLGYWSSVCYACLPVLSLLCPYIAVVVSRT